MGYEYSGHPGRPKYMINADQIIELYEKMQNWEAVASHLGISIQTLWRLRKSMNISKFYKQA